MGARLVGNCSRGTAHVDDTSTPQLPERREADLGQLAHRMNNAIAYVITNLNLLAEELEGIKADAATRTQLLQHVDEASDGAERVGALIRRLKVLSWGGRDGPAPGKVDDTWETASPRASILVIDDESHILSAVRRALRVHAVTLANSGTRALELLEEGGNYDVILCDLIMREVSGIDLHNHLVEHHPELVERVVFMTAGAFTSQLRDFLSTVDNTVLHKPFDTKTLRWLVAQKMRERLSARG